MKILFISIYDPLKGASGPGNHLRYLSEALSQLNCEVHIITYGSPTKSIKVNGVYIHYFKPKFFGSLGKGALFSFLSIGITNRIIDEYAIDIVHGQSPSSFGYALLSPKKVPFIVTLHGTSFGELYSLFKIPSYAITPKTIKLGLTEASMAFLTKIEYALAQKVVSVSKSIAVEAQNYYHLPENKVIVIHNGINSLPLKQKNKQKATLILFVGRLTWRKGVHYLIDAFSKLVKKNNVMLKIVGYGDQEKSLRLRVNSMGLKGSIQFLSNISQKRLFELYHEADIYVQPSLYEPFSIAIMEAMSCGTAVVASNVSGIPELITNGKEGILVEPRNSEMLSHAISRLLSDSAIREYYGFQAFTKVNRDFIWKSIAQKTVELYQNILI
jgi:glycogen synthase